MRRIASALLSAAVLLAVGCTGQVIADAARSSLSSFITTVLTTGVNNAINNP